MFKKYVSILLAASMLFVTSLSVCALGGKDSGNMQDTPELSAYYEALDSYLNHMAAADASMRDARTARTVRLPHCTATTSKRRPVFCLNSERTVIIAAM